MITLAGIPLLLPDKTGEVQGWLDAYLPLETMREQATPVALASHRAQSRSGYRAGVGLPMPNYPPPPKPKINSLYWPTGASRWARGYFLASDSILEQLLAAIGDTNAVQSLVLKDERQDVTITAKVHLLPPRPITAVEAVEGQDRKGLWLLPVVDARYYWQWKHAANFEVDNEATWESLFSLLGTAVGATVAVDPSVGDYKLPDVDELTRRYENAAVLLDALAHSSGRRIVVNFDGSVKAMGFAAADTTLGENLTEYALVAGGEIEAHLAAITPATVLVTFPKWREHYPDPNGDLHTVEIEAEGGSTPDTVKVIHSSAFADFTEKDPDPDNDADLDALAEVIAGDFYASLKHFDYSLPSLFAWTPTSFDDAIEFRFGSLREGDYEAYSRVHSRPYNFGDEEQLQQFGDMKVYPRLARFKLTENLEIGGGASAIFIDGNDGETDTDDELTVHDTLGESYGLAGEEISDKGWAEYKSDSLQWEIVSMDGSLTRPGTASGAISAGSSGSINIGTTVTGVNQSSADVESGDRVLAHYSPSNQVWFFTAPGSGTRKFWHCTLNDEIPPGATGTITLSDATIGTAGQVEAENWSNTHPGVQGAHGMAWKDVDDSYQFFPDAERWWLAALDADLAASDATAAIKNVVSITGGTVPGSLDAADNQFELSGSEDDTVLIVESPNAGSEKYILVQITSRANKPRWFKAKLNGALNPEDGTATVDNVVALDGGSSPTITSVKNPHARRGLDNADCLFVEDWGDLDEDDNPTHILADMREEGPYLCKTDIAINKAASGTCSIWTGTMGSESDSGANVTAYNRFANVGSGKWCWVDWNGHAFYIIAAECPLT